VHLAAIDPLSVSMQEHISEITQIIERR